MEIIEQSENSFQMKLKEREVTLYHYREKVRMLEERCMEGQGQLAQASAQVRFMAMREAEHAVEIK